ncbi:MAG: hypothetical protein SFY80_15845 [Verrucomicrobiota bacterium]|nr:hypothetical protein [Verrucomicrobiota bacterium]
MPPSDLNPGDRVVELAALVISAAVATGAVASAWILWLIKKSWMASAGALIAGAVVGFLVGQLLGRVLYHTGGNTTVVKVGSASLLSTIRAGLAGGVVTALAVAILAVLIFSTSSQSSSLFCIAIGCGVVLGILFACLGSLL